MRRILTLSAVPAVLSGVLAWSRPVSLCDGFLPPNTLQIPIGSADAKGLTREQYDQVLDRVEKVYGPVVAARGGELEIERLWDDPTVNAAATRRGSKYVIMMYGGLARHATITQDGFAIVACHELGHHIGGFPKKSWASNEGQSDYYANLKCLRRLFSGSETASFTKDEGVDPVAASACAASYKDEGEKALCERGSMAGMSVAQLFRALRRQDAQPRFDTPDPNQASRTNDAHPATQCRLDTYYNGSLCTKPVSEETSDQDPKKGTCTASQGFSSGLRPRCWYKPADGELVAPLASRVAPAARQSVVREGGAFDQAAGAQPWKGL